MSQKTRRSQRNSADESLASFKTPGVQQTNETDPQQDSNDNSQKNTVTTNGDHKSESSVNEASSNVTGVQTRSRSSTPLIKTKSENEQEIKEQKDEVKTEVVQEIILEEIVENCSNISGHPQETEELIESSQNETAEVLHIELIQSTPRVVLQREAIVEDKLDQAEVNLTFDSISTNTDDISTQAVAGNDTTHLTTDVTYQEISFEEPPSRASFNYSVTKRHSYLSPRPSIRPLAQKEVISQTTDSYRKSGAKRKATDDLLNPTDLSKRFKNDSSVFSTITGPFSAIRNKLYKTPNTPNEDDSAEFQRRCSIM